MGAGRARLAFVGAVLAVRRDIFDAAGRFDERFPFEYEETEWEDRVRSKGFDLVGVPGARVRHLWAVSASAIRRPRSAVGNRSASTAPPLRAPGPGAAGKGGAIRLPRPARRGSATQASAQAGAAVALSPNPSVSPAADLSEEFQLPDEVAAGLAAGPWYLTVFRTADGRPIQRFLWLKASA